MKEFSLFMLTYLSFSISVFSQNTEATNIWDIKSEIERKFIDAYDKNGNLIESKGEEPYKRELNDLIEKSDRNGLFPKDYSIDKTLDNYLLMNKDLIARRINLDGKWKSLGPDKVYDEGFGLGRVNCIAFHPSNKSTFWIGSPSGGIWKTEDFGKSWIPLGDKLPSSGVISIAVDYTNPNIIYVATGDGSTIDSEMGAFSAGLYKSTNGGQTWNPTNLTWKPNNKMRLSKILINPINPQILWATSSQGIYKIHDGGDSLELHLKGAFSDIVLKPNDPNIIYATTFDWLGNARLYLLNDITKEHYLIQQFAQINRMRLAVCKKEPERLDILLSSSADNAFGGLFRYDYSSKILEIINPEKKWINYLGWSKDGGDSKGQGDYDLAYTISPTNPNRCYLGGINTWRTNDSGNTWELENYFDDWDKPQNVDYVHADKHDLVFHPFNDSWLFECNDGGLYFKDLSKKDATWKNLSDGLVISQCYRISCAPKSEIILAGFQDNGTKLFEKNRWYDILSGDGADCQIDPLFPNIMYASNEEGKFYQSYDGFWSFEGTPNLLNPIYKNIYDRGKVSWIAPITIDQKESYKIYTGYETVHYSFDRGNTWKRIIEKPIVPSRDSSKVISIITINPVNSNIVFAATRQRIFKFRYNTKLKKFNQNFINQPSVLDSLNLSSLTIHPKDSNRIFITLSGFLENKKIYESKDGGNTWKNISQTLPNFPANCLAIDELTGSVYLGMDRGIYLMEATDSLWYPYYNKLPNVMIRDLEIHQYNKAIRAATFGRGIWESPLFEEQNYQISNNFEEFKFAKKSQNDTAILFDYAYREIKHIPLKNKKKIIVPTDLPSGQYFVGFKSENCKNLEKLVKLSE